MTSYLRRYLAGEHEEVWAELRALGRIPDAIAEDCAAVAAETMDRVRRHVVRLGEQYTDLGLQMWWDGVETIGLPSHDELATLDRVASEIGGLPFALEACLRRVGPVCLVGEVAALTPAGDLGVLTDALMLPSVEQLAYEWADVRDKCPFEQVDDDPATVFSWEYYEHDCFYFNFAPDSEAKATMSGSVYVVRLPSTIADPVIRGIDDGVLLNPTLVQYLRHTIAWGGQPGWAARPQDAPGALERLRTRPDF